MCNAEGYQVGPGVLSFNEDQHAELQLRGSEWDSLGHFQRALLSPSSLFFFVPESRDGKYIEKMLLFRRGEVSSHNLQDQGQQVHLIPMNRWPAAMTVWHCPLFLLALDRAFE